MNPNGTVASSQVIALGIGQIGGNALFGMSVAGLGDVDGDGVPDLAVGAPWANAQMGPCSSC